MVYRFATPLPYPDSFGLRPVTLRPYLSEGLPFIEFSDLHNIYR